MVILLRLVRTNFIDLVIFEIGCNKIYRSSDIVEIGPNKLTRSSDVTEIGLKNFIDLVIFEIGPNKLYRSGDIAQYLSSDDLSESSSTLF